MIDRRTFKVSEDLGWFLEDLGLKIEDLPHEKIVCPVCKGKGAHVNPSIDSEGLTAEDFEQDPDFEESYFSGAYDVRCNECDGENVIDSINWKRAEERHPGIWEKWVAWEDEAHADRMSDYYERQAGC